jgi:hypothetical protein
VLQYIGNGRRVRAALPDQRGGLVGCPYTATTTVRSKLFADHTPIWELAQLDMMAKYAGL